MRGSQLRRAHRVAPSALLVAWLLAREDFDDAVHHLSFVGCAGAKVTTCMDTKLRKTAMARVDNSIFIFDEYFLSQKSFATHLAES